MIRLSGKTTLTTLALWLLASLGSLCLPVAAQADDAKRVDKLESELEAIRAEVSKLREELAARDRAEADQKKQQTGPPGDGDRLTEIERRIEILAQEVERKKIGSNIFPKAVKSEHGLGIAASKVYQVEQGLSIGGYGEMLFEDFDSSRDNGSPSGATDQFDFLRGVFYVGYKFTDKWVFNSEIEFEHAATDREGSASVEFATIDYLWKDKANFRAGLLLVPMGFVNELHEPPLFLGAKRPGVEQRIIPSTWRENGFGVFGDIGPFTYRTYIINGLAGERFSSNGIRGGRQKGSEALAEDLAWTGRLDYTGKPGLLVGVSGYVGGSGQGLTDSVGRVIEAQTTLFEAHLEWKFRGLEVRALGAWGEIDDVARLNGALGLTGSASIGEEFEGQYLQIGYDVLAHRQGKQALIPYVRLETYDTQAAVPNGFSRNPARNIDLLTLGFAYKPIDQISFKVDFQDFENVVDTGTDQFNFALGYLF